MDWKFLGHYGTLGEFLLKHGRKMEPMHGLIDMGEPGTCYGTSWERSCDFGLEYCEGYAVSKGAGIPLQHAWCVNEYGDVLDPTWDDGVEYWGVVIPTQTVIRVMEKTWTYGVLCDLWMLKPQEVDRVLEEIAEYAVELSAV